MQVDRRPETILVVEDAEPIRKLVCTMLSQTGYTCLEASDGAEALQLLEEVQHVQLVLTDVLMPNMSGAELARHLARTRPQLRIIFMSGYNEDPMVQSLAHTPSRFLPKPFTAASLTEKVRQALEEPWNGTPGTDSFMQ